MTDYQKLVDFFMDELPEDSPWEGNVKSLVEKLIANGVTFATENNGGSKCSQSQPKATQAGGVQPSDPPNPIPNPLNSIMCSKAVPDASKAEAENKANRWIPVTERLPEKSGRYLALTPSIVKGCDYLEWIIRYDTKGGFYDYDSVWGDIPMDDVTHWMPLPEPPKGCN